MHTINRNLLAPLAGIAIATAAIMPGLSGAQSGPPAGPMIVVDRGQTLEILPGYRGVPTVSATDKVVRNAVVTAAADAPVSSQSLGVVFNHTLSTYAFVTGEILFKVKGTGIPADLKAMPGFVRLPNTDIHEVVAGTPAQIPALLAQLRARSDLEWVQLSVHYGAAANRATPVPAGAPGTPHGTPPGFAGNMPRDKAVK